MTKPIHSSVIERYHKAIEEVAVTEDMIFERLDYILRIVNTVCNNNPKDKDYTWWIDGAEENDVGDFSEILVEAESYIDVESICFYPQIERDLSRYTAIIGGNEYYLSEQIPIRWMFESFEDELADGVKSYRKDQKKYKNV